MTEVEFLEPWRWLLVQPWAVKLFKNEQDEEVLRGIFQKHIMQSTGQAWADAVDLWIVRENRWPTLAEILVVVKMKVRPAPEVDQYNAGFQAPPRGLQKVFQAWRKNPDRSYTETVVDELTKHTKEYPEDYEARDCLDRARASFENKGEKRERPFKISAGMTHLAQVMKGMEALEGDSDDDKLPL